MSHLSDQAQTRLALAALAAAFAKTLDESDESFALRFGDNLRELYATMREAESPSTDVLETLKWTQELLK
jgi:hypothetical protein